MQIPDMLQQPQSGSPAAPGQGRSRYSKALPAVPGLSRDEPPALPPLKSLPITDDVLWKSNNNITSQQPGGLGGSYLPAVSVGPHSTNKLPPSMPSTFTSQEAAVTKALQSEGSGIKKAIPRKPIRKPVPELPQQPASRTSPSSSSSIPIILPPQASRPHAPVSQVSKTGRTGTSDSTSVTSFSPVSAMSSTRQGHAGTTLSPSLPSPIPPSPSGTLSSILSAYSKSMYGNDAEERDEEMSRESYGTATNSTASNRTSDGTVTLESKRSTGLSSSGMSNDFSGGDGPGSGKNTLPSAVAYSAYRPQAHGHYSTESRGVSSRGSAGSPAYASAVPSNLTQGLGIVHRTEESGNGIENARVAPRLIQLPGRSVPLAPQPQTSTEAKPQEARQPNNPENRSAAANTTSGSLPEVPPKEDNSSPNAPPNQRIWRRRSLTGSKDLPSLSLDFSNGSTAASNPPQDSSTSSANRQTHPSRGSQESERDKELPSPPKPHKLPELPAEAYGRSDSEKPNVPPKESFPPLQTGSDAPTMGNETSKLKQQLKEKLPNHHGRKDSSSTKSERTLRPSTHRPPTPEYRKEDFKAPIVETVDAPVSPATTPDLALPKGSRNGSKSNLSGETIDPGTEEQPPAMNEPREVSRKALPEAALPPPPSIQTNALHAARSLPDLKGNTPSPIEHPPLPGYGALYARRESVSSEAGPPGRPRPSADAGRFHPRGPFGRPDGRMSVEPSGRSPPAPEMDPRMVYSDEKGWMYRGRDGTLYPEMNTLAEPDPRAFEFPIPRTLPPIDEGAVMDAPPIRRGHYNCFHKHKTMRRSTNKRHPISCQSCRKADAEDRLTCVFCNLRICEECFHILDSKKRDLSSLMEELRTNPSLSLSSNVRPTSAFGVELEG